MSPKTSKGTESSAAGFDAAWREFYEKHDKLQTPPPGAINARQYADVARAAGEHMSQENARMRLGRLTDGGKLDTGLFRVRFSGGTGLIRYWWPKKK